MKVNLQLFGGSSLPELSGEISRLQEAKRQNALYKSGLNLGAHTRLVL
jgi:hypothetical protein